MQISTDHYFCGQGDLKHDESAPVTLLNEYARTKYAGEAFALTNPEACVIRTNVVGFRGWEVRPCHGPVPDFYPGRTPDGPI